MNSVRNSTMTFTEHVFKKKVDYIFQTNPRCAFYYHKCTRYPSNIEILVILKETAVMSNIGRFTVILIHINVKLLEDVSFKTPKITISINTYYDMRNETGT